MTKYLEMNKWFFIKVSIIFFLVASIVFLVRTIDDSLQYNKCTNVGGYWAAPNHCSTICAGHNHSIPYNITGDTLTCHCSEGDITTQRACLY